MNVTALITGVGGAAYGAMAVWLVVLQKRRWACCGLLAIAASLLITMVTVGNRSHPEGTVVFLTTCMLIAISGVCWLMDARARRGRSRN